MHRSVILVLCLVALSAVAQEGNLQSDFRRERKHVREACDTFGLKLVTGCAYTLFTDHPLHIAAGSMPPQNGFGLGVAFSEARNTANWRMSWDVDAVGAIVAVDKITELDTGKIFDIQDHLGVSLVRVNEATGALLIGGSAGTAGQCLKSQGAASPPQWTTC